MYKEFTGFPKELFHFLAELGENNNRAWFQDNRDRYEKYFLKPAFAYIEAVGPLLKKEIPKLEYAPKVNRSIFRINRDARFSKDKSPYKTHLGVTLWSGPNADRSQNPGFYLHIEANRLLFATGGINYSQELLKEYRSSLLSKKYAAEFTKVVNGLHNNDLEITSNGHYVRYPKGFTQQHELGKYSLFKDLVVVQTDDFGIPDIVYTKEMLDYTMAFYSKTYGFMRWVEALHYRAANI